jgi:hypothetical protein
MDVPPSGHYDYARTALPHAQTRTVRWHDVLRAEPEPQRALTTDELRRLHHLGFHALARALAAGVCLTCGLNRDGRAHRELCEKPDPLPAPTPIAQPWMPRAPRQRRAA